MGQVLGIVYRVIAMHLIRKSGFTHKTAHTGAVTLIQPFGSAQNLNIHSKSIYAAIKMIGFIIGVLTLNERIRSNAA